MEPIVPIAAGLVLVIYGWLKLGAGRHLFPLCTRCRNPMPSGYDSSDKDGKYCRPCTHQTGRKPWWHRPGYDKPLPVKPPDPNDPRASAKPRAMGR